jgi:hypothetical protein
MLAVSDLDQIREQYLLIAVPLTLHNTGHFPVSTTSTEVLTNLEPHHHPPYFVYKFNPDPVEGLVVQSERVIEVYGVGQGKTRYVSWETYYGAGSVALLATIKTNLEIEFEKQAEDLRKRVESLE